VKLHGRRVGRDTSLVQVPARPTAAIREIPDDAALPQMARLLDTGEMAEVLKRALGDGRSPRNVRIPYLRYKPGTNLVVRYEVELGGGRHDATAMIASGDFLERRAQKPENRALAKMVGSRSPSRRSLVFDPALRCLIQWYPLDLSIPALAEPLGALSRRFQSVGVSIRASGEEPARLAYKPRRRAVLVLDRHVVKCYAKDAEFLASAAAMEISSALGSAIARPEFEGALPSERVTAQTLLSGRAIDGEAGATAAGSLLSELHAADLRQAWRDLLPVARPDRQLTAAAASANLVAVIAPPLRRRVQRLLRTLERSIPQGRELVPSHGDFHARQLLRMKGGLALTDFDGFCVAPPALDIATYVAHVVRGESSDLASAETVLYRLLDGYGDWPSAINWYVATTTLGRAPAPFRQFQRDWPDRVEMMVDTAEAALKW
jgi:hypothetical protein